MNRESAHFVFRYFPELTPEQVRQMQQPQSNGNTSISAPNGIVPRFTTTNSNAMRFSRPSAEQYTYANAEAVSEVADAVSAQIANENSAPKTIINTAPKIGRNDPCPFDPNKKFKKCCGAAGGTHCVKQQ
jgi:uncharacterized protein YecA (UPF0149 family)